MLVRFWVNAVLKNRVWESQVDPRFDLARDLLGEVTPTRLKIPTLAKIVSRCYNKRT